MDVITVTGNLLAEWTFDVAELRPGATHRAAAMSFQVGGKGFNVTRILRRLGGESLALGFAGGPLAQLCGEWLDQRAVPHRFFPIEGGVRPGVVVRAAGEPETTFLGADIPVHAAAWEAACRFAATARPRWVAVCGSIPGWQPGWIKPLREVADAGIRVAVDTYGPPLADLVTLPLEVVKINRAELQRLFPESAGSPTTGILRRAREGSPVGAWIITDGPRPVVADWLDGRRWEILPAPVGEVSATGSGDTFLAALLHSWSNGMEPAEALARAAACATASAASPGIGDFPLPVPEQCAPAIRRIS